VRRADKFPPACSDCLEIWEPHLLETSGPGQACAGIVFLIDKYNLKHNLVVMNLSKDFCIKFMRYKFGIKEPSHNLLEGRRKPEKRMSRWPVTGNSNYTQISWQQSCKLEKKMGASKYFLTIIMSLYLQFKLLVKNNRTFVCFWRNSPPPSGPGPPHSQGF